MMQKIKIILVLSLLSNICLLLNANMASPFRGGSAQGTPYSSRNITILHEQLNIKITQPAFAEFDITYTIHVDRVGSKFPLIFDTSSSMDKIQMFKVWVDGDSISVSELPEMYRSDSVNQEWIHYFRAEYDFKNESLGGMKYFEVDTLVIGTHTIKVKYTALATNNLSGVVREYDFQYSLRPALEWREFNALDVQIDVADLDMAWKFNFPEENKVGDYQWHFEEIPQDMLRISLEPNLNWWQSLIAKADGQFFTLFGILVYIVGNVYLILKFRKEQQRKKAISSSIIGTLLFPFWGTLSCLFSLWVTNLLLGNWASGGVSPYILIFTFFLLVLIIPIYAISAALVDYGARRKLGQKKSKD